MGLWNFLGGNINYERVTKNIEKEIKYQNELFAICFKAWKNSDMPIEKKIEFAIKQWGEEHTRIFLNRYPNLVSDELNPFLTRTNLSEIGKLQLKLQELEIKNQRNIDELIDWNKQLQEENEKLKNEIKHLKSILFKEKNTSKQKEIWDKNLTIKELQNISRNK